MMRTGSALHGVVVGILLAIPTSYGSHRAEAATLTVTEHQLGQAPDAFPDSPVVLGLDDILLYRFKLSTSSDGGATVTELDFHVTFAGPVSQFIGPLLFVDVNDNGIVDEGVDTEIVRMTSGSGEVMRFEGLSIPVSPSGKQFILFGDQRDMFGPGGSTVLVGPGGTLTIDLPGSRVTASDPGTGIVAATVGAASIATHINASQPVPEPSTLLLLASGLAALMGAAWRARRRT